MNKIDLNHPQIGDIYDRVVTTTDSGFAVTFRKVPTTTELAEKINEIIDYLNKNATSDSRGDGVV